MARISKSELIRLQKTLITDKAISEKFGISRQAVHQLRVKYGIPVKSRKPSRPPVTKAELQRLQKKLGADMAVGVELGMSRDAVAQLRHRYGMPPSRIDNTRRNAGIVKLNDNGTSGTIIAKRLGLAKITVYKILAEAHRTRTGGRKRRYNRRRGA
jgi:biotin operon repressor